MLRFVLLVGGLLTTTPGILAFRPELLRDLLGIDYQEQYAIIVSHWGFLVGLLGLMMMAAAFVKKIRFTVTLYAAIEKFFMVFLYLQYREHAFAAAFLPVALIDGTLAITMTACMLGGRHCTSQPPPAV